MNTSKSQLKRLAVQKAAKLHHLKFVGSDTETGEPTEVVFDAAWEPVAIAQALFKECDMEDEKFTVAAWVPGDGGPDARDAGIIIRCRANMVLCRFQSLIVGIVYKYNHMKGEQQ